MTEQKTEQLNDALLEKVTGGDGMSRELLWKHTLEQIYIPNLERAASRASAADRSAIEKCIETLRAIPDAGNRWEKVYAIDLLIQQNGIQEEAMRTRVVFILQTVRNIAMNLG